jgi:hypothetical protein
MRRKQAAVTPSARDGGTVISTADMCSLAARLSGGTATAADLRLADKLIMALVTRLPPNGALDI